MSAHLPVLLVVVPMLSAPLLVLVKERRITRVMALMATAATAVVGWALVLAAHQQTEPVRYYIGGWVPPVGIEYVVTKASAYVVAVVASVAAVGLLLGARETRRAVRDGQEHYFYAAYLLCLAGLLGMAITGDAFNVFVFLEISSLSTYALIAMGKRRRSFTAAFNYLLLGSIGGTFVLIGIGLLYQVTGTLNGAEIAAHVQAAELASEAGNRTLLVAFSFTVVGLCLKLAVFPLHQWLPAAYSESPAAVAAFLSGTATKVIYFQLVRTTVVFFGAVHTFGVLRFGERVLMPLSVLGMFIGSIAAVYQTSLRRLLAYSSVAQLGYLTLALSLGTEAGVQAGLLHLGAHALTKAGLFALVAAIVASVGTDRLEGLRGLGKRMPFVSLGLVVGGASLIGVPGTAGFVSKWALLQASLDAGYAPVAVLLLLSSLVAVAYVWRMVEVMYFREPPAGWEAKTTRRDAPPLLAAAILLGASVYFGFMSQPVLDLTENAAAQLFEEPGPLPVVPAPRHGGEHGHADQHAHADEEAP
ncbi:MAG: monovalent cation/H+ antiporter subunit D family protein [Sandaracinaceae bacterium]